MVKKITPLLFILIVVFLLGGLYFYWQSNSLPTPKKVVQQNMGVSPTPTVQTTETTPQESLNKTIFVPSWTCDGQQNTDVNNWDRMVYFGVTATTAGINTYETGYTSMKECLTHFMAFTHKYLAVRMLDSDTNLAVLKNKTAQQKIIADTISLAQENQFDGVVIDLEMSGIFNDDVSGQITNFISAFHTQAQKANLKLAITAYGDTFYRKRPYDIQSLSTNVDEIMIMAYDLHKARGEPGPNFPLTGKESYGYDFETMISEFLKVTQVDKINVIFGMYGYDWIVDENQRPIREATAVTYNQAKEKFLDSCKWSNCLIQADDKAAETQISYIDKALNYHIIWLENQQSIDKKTLFLKSQGINTISYWAYSYF